MSNIIFGLKEYSNLRDECAAQQLEIQEAAHGYTVQRTDDISNSQWEGVRGMIEERADRHIIDSGDSLMVLKPSETQSSL